MEQKTLYVCEQCGTSYASEHDARICEEGHCPAKRIRSMKFVPVTMDRTGYPTYVSIVMGDGVIKRYKRC